MGGWDGWTAEALRSASVCAALRCAASTCDCRHRPLAARPPQFAFRAGGQRFKRIQMLDNAMHGHRGLTFVRACGLLCVCVCMRVCAAFVRCGPSPAAVAVAAMVNIGAVKTRVADLLTYFSKEYVKAYKAALVESLRNKANGVEGGDEEPGRPDFTLPLLDENRLPVALPRVEGVVAFGADLKEVRHWSMDKKFIVTQTEIKKEKGAAASSSSDGPASPTSPMSPTPVGAIAGDGQEDQL